MAALRNTALNLAHLQGQANVVRVQRRTSWLPGAVPQTLEAA